MSHSAHGSEELELLDRLAATLHAEQIDAFIANHDMRLGEYWGRRLRAELRDCDGGIVLVNRSALKSKWVDREVDRMLSRRGDDDEEDFPIIPFLVGGVTRGDLAASDLNDHQLTSMHLVAEGQADLERRIAEEVVRRLPPRGPLCLLEEEVVSLMDGLGSVQLDTAGERLGVRLAGLTLREKKRAVARKLFSTNPSTFVHAFEALSRRMGADAAEVINLSFPFTWIDERAAAPLCAPASATTPSCTAFGVNTKEELTGRMYVRRSSAEPQVYWAEALPATDWELASAYLREVKLALQPILGMRVDRPESDDAVRRAIAAHEGLTGSAEQPWRRPIVVLLPDGVDDECLTLLRETFPTLVYLVLAGADRQLPLPDSIHLLQPALRSDHEDLSLQQYRKILPMVRS